MDKLDIQFHFPYDKVTVMGATKADADYYASMMRRDSPFEVKLLDYKGEPTGGIEIVNPRMVTHVSIAKHLPF